MSADIGGGVIGYNPEKGTPKDHSINWQSSFRGENFYIFLLTGSLVKTMSADIGGLGLGGVGGSWDLILKKNHLRTIPTKFDSNWLRSFRA